MVNYSEYVTRAMLDPAASLEQLADVAIHFPELRASTARHPAATPEFLAWLQSLPAPPVVVNQFPPASAPPVRRKARQGGRVVLALVLAVVLFFAGLGAGHLIFARPTPPSEWKMSLEGFGPLRIGMTKAEAIATGGFRYIEFCELGALEWTGQYREDGESLVIANLDERGLVWAVNIFSNPSPLDTGIGLGSSWEELQRAYGDRLIADAEYSNGAGLGNYAVNGDVNYLRFYLESDGRGSSRLAYNTGISLRAGNVTPTTIPNVSSCGAAWRK